MHSENITDSRRFSRVQHTLEVKYRTLTESEGLFRYGLSSDIAVSGIRLNLPEKIPTGRRIIFSIKNSLNDDWLPEVNGIVAWQSDYEAQLGQFTTGIHFSSDQVFLNSYLQNLMGTLKFVTIKKNFKTVDDFVNLPDEKIEMAYDGSKVTFKLLRLFGWGPLNNLGYFRFRSPFSIMNVTTSLLKNKILFLLPEAQRRLIVKSIGLLDIQKGEKILDVGCGKGMSSFLLANTHPEALVTGVDILSRNINASKALFGGAHNLRFAIDDAMKLSCGDKVFDKIMCVEAAFHFPDKTKFLLEAFRVLKRKGRLLVVDFMWVDGKRRPSRHDLKANFVKSEWHWEDFFSVGDYLSVAKEAGFTVSKCHDWSPNVTGPLEVTFLTLAFFGSFNVGRAFLCKINPLLESVSKDEWKAFLDSALAHKYLRKRVKYVALSLSKEN